MCEILRKIFYCVTAILILNTEIGKCDKYEDQLYEDLLYFYINHVRPVANESERVMVGFGASLIRLIDLNEKEQILTTNLWLELQWKDPSLVWNPADYGGIERLHISSALLWTPDIILYNNAAGDPQITINNDAMVYYDGSIVWKPPSIYKSFCAIDIKWFPYDEQFCELKFGGWSHNALYLDMEQIPKEKVVEIEGFTDPVDNKKLTISYMEMGMDLSYYYPSATWDLMNMTSQRKEKIYAGCCGPDFYVDITFYMHFRRKPLFFTVNLVIPCMLLAILSTFVFYLPAHSGVKVTYSISIFVTLAVLFMVLTDLIPPTSLVVPLMGKFLLFTCILVTISVIVSVITMNFHLRTGATHQMPMWMKVLFMKKLPPLLFIKPSEDNFDETEANTSESEDEFDPGSKLADYRRQSMVLPKDNIPSISEISLEKLAPADPTEPVDHYEIIQKMLRNVQVITKHFKTIAEEDSESAEWSYVAMVIDRLFLFIFTATNLLGITMIILKAPTLHDSTSPIFIKTPILPLGGDTNTPGMM